VYFRYNKKQFRFKKDINRIKDLKQRQHEGNFLASLLLEKLQSGWNPVDGIRSTLLVDALEFALSKKKVSKKTMSGYRGTVTFITDAIKELSLDHFTIQQTKRSDLRVIMEKVKETRKWSNKAYNKHLGHLKAVLSVLGDWDIIQHNPAHHIKNLHVSYYKGLHSYLTHP